MGHSQKSGFSLGAFLWNALKLFLTIIFKIVLLVFVFIGKLTVALLEKIVELVEKKLK
jgi:hypothetical protein